MTTDEVQAFLEELDRIPWFAHVGEPLSDGDVVTVASWDEAFEALQDESNTYASYHDENAPAHPVWSVAYQRAYGAVERSGRNRDLSTNNPVARSAAWDSGGAAVHLATGNPDSFYLVMLDWYRRGRWPCRWEGDYPRGKLIVF